MSLSIRTNLASLDAQRNLNKTQNMLEASMSKLSSGMRITKAGDDAAGLGISTNLEAQVKSYNQAGRNANDGLSVLQTGEAALNSTTNILTRLRELAMQSASDGVGTSERAYIATEAKALSSEIDRTANTAEYNGVKLLNTGSATPLTFQVGIRNTSDDRLSVSLTDATVSGLGLSTLDLSSATGAQAALASIDSALSTVSSKRADFGAVGNRFQGVIDTIQSFSQSLSAADSRIRDVNVAEETSNLSRSQILAQAGVSVLGQANQLPQMALKLLG